MTKRRRASELMFKSGNIFRPGKLSIVAVTSGTGTIAAAGIITILATTALPSGQSVYLTISSGTNIGTLVGTGIGA